WVRRLRAGDPVRASSRIDANDAPRRGGRRVPRNSASSSENAVSIPRTVGSIEAVAPRCAFVNGISGFGSVLTHHEAGPTVASGLRRPSHGKGDRARSGRWLRARWEHLPWLSDPPSRISLLTSRQSGTRKRPVEPAH